MTVYICGDSTAASYSVWDAPMTGWGQALPRFLPGVRVENRAFAGRSSKSFISEGRLQKIETEIAPGDLMMIQFAHNDESGLVWRHTDPWTSYTNTLSIFADTALMRGAVPVLLTPVCLRTWREGRLEESHGAYPEAVRTLAMTRRLPLIDMYLESRRIVEEMGEEKSKRLFMRLPEGVFPRFIAGREDDAHTRLAGAEAFAAFAAAELKKSGLLPGG